MAVTYGFYNSVNGDRKYNAQQFGKMFDGLIGDGIYATIGTAMMVKASTGMEVVVGTGRAWFNQTWTENDSLLVVEIPQSELLLDRIDAIVLRVSQTDDTRTNSIEVVKGTPSSEEPAKPVLKKENDIYEYPLCYIFVERGATEIIQSNITNTVGTSECPFVTGIIETINIDGLIAQWQDEWDRWVNDTVFEFEKDRQKEFDLWFDTIREQLDEDTAGNLQNQIYDLYDKNEFFGELILTEDDYNNNLQTKLDEHITATAERASRKGDQVIVICEELDKKEIWICNRIASTNTWRYFSSNEMVYPSKLVEAAVYASKWIGNTYSFEEDYPADEYDLSVYLSSSCTREQVVEWNNGYVLGSGTSNVLTAVGVTPTLDIPVTLKVVRK